MDSPLAAVLAVLHSDALLERLASVEHERWSHWQRYLHERCIEREDGSLIIPAEYVRRWSAQLNTFYGDLSEEEKESDRDQVRRYLPEIELALKKALGPNYGSQTDKVARDY